MSYSYAKRSFPRRRRPAGRGGAAGWLAVVVLAVAIAGIWWAKNEPEIVKIPEDTTIIPSSEAINNPEDFQAAPAAAQTQESTMTLRMEGFTVWGVQKGIYGTRQAAQEAAGEKDILFDAEDGCRVIESVWGDKSQAQARGEAISTDSYAAQLTASGLNLKLTGSSDKLAAVETAVRTWEEVLKELREVQTLLEAGGMSRTTAQQYAAAVQARLTGAQEAVPDETQVLSAMREALLHTEQAMEEIVAANAEEEVDFVEIFRYNTGISHMIYNDYLGELLSSS